MIDVQSNRLALLDIKGVEKIESDELTISDLVTRKVDDDGGVSVDDLVNRNVNDAGGVDVEDLVNRDYDVILQPSSVYLNVLTVNIHMLTSVPIVKVDNIEGKAIDPALTIAQNESPLLDPDIKLYDPDMDDRYKLISTPKSLFSDNYVHIYWDKKYADIFVIPDISNITSKDTYKTLEGLEIGLRGSAVGTNLSDFVETELINSYTTPVTCNEEPTGGTAKSYLKKLTMSHNTYPIVEADIKVDDKSIGNSHKLRPIQFINLGTIEDIFGDDKVPTYHLFSNTPISQYFIYNGVYKVPEIVIPLQF